MKENKTEQKNKKKEKENKKSVFSKIQEIMEKENDKNQSKKTLEPKNKKNKNKKQQNEFENEFTSENKKQKKKKNKNFQNNDVKEGFNSKRKEKTKRTKTEEKFKPDPNEETLKIIPLGGLREFGKNITVFEYKKEIIIVDVGFSFPTEEQPGIDLIIPDFSYLRERKEKIKGVFFTHAHEDHIGGVPFFLKEFKAPLFGTKLTLGLIEKKFSEYKVNADMKIVKGGDKIKIGKHFKIEIIRTTHSIPDSIAFSIETPKGIIFHTGDFKIDETPMDEVPIDFDKIRSISKKGIKLLMSDSTNAPISGATRSERTLKKIIDDIFKKNKDKRIIVATFSSNLHRIQTIIDAAQDHGKKVALSGRSIEKVVETAKKLGYLKVPSGVIIDQKNLDSVSYKKLVIIMTGSQGEPMAALTRVANRKHKHVRIKSTDLVVISSSPIPGNERAISTNVDHLLEMGADVLYSDIADIHVSGHARADELRMMLKATNPEYFFPIHGEYRMLVAHSKLAQEQCSINKENIFILKNGNILEMSNEGVRKRKESLHYDPVFIDGHGVGDIVDAILKERMVLGEAGVIVISAYVDLSTWEILDEIKIFSKGFINAVENTNIYDDLRDIAEKELVKIMENEIKEEKKISSLIKKPAYKFIQKKLNRFPILLVNIVDRSNSLV